jgi:hypothetical protein
MRVRVRLLPLPCLHCGTRARALIHSDPYAGGERSGKQAKPDSLSAVANLHARARALLSTAGAGASTCGTRARLQFQVLVVISRLHNVLTLLCRIAYLKYMPYRKLLIKTLFMVYDDK